MNYKEKYDNQDDYNHKEYMEWLKEADPILYSELTSNPTGSEDAYTSMTGFIICLMILIVIIFLTLL